MNIKKTHKIISFSILILIFFLTIVGLLINKVSIILITIAFVLIIWGLSNLFFVRYIEKKKTLSLFFSYMIFLTILSMEKKIYKIQINFINLLICILIGVILSIIYVKLLKKVASK